jgi:hypothetical protein
MKQWLIILNLLCCLKSSPCAGQQISTYFNDKDSTFISGKVIDFKPEDGDAFISFLVFDIGGKSKKHSFQISPDGSFNVAVLQYFAGDITLNYRNAFTSIFARPGSHLEIVIQSSAIQEGNRWGTKVFSAKGELADVNNLLFDFESKIRDHEFAHEVDMGNKQQTDSTFALQKLNKLQERLAFLDSYINSRKIDNNTFINWQKNQLTYDTGHEILLFPFLGKMNKTITDTQLLAFVNSIPISNPSALFNSAYYDFLQMLTGGHQIIVNINQAYEPLEELIVRIEALVGKNQLFHTTESTANNLVTIGLFRYDIMRHTLSYNNSLIRLSARESEVLEVLFTHKSQLLTRKALLLQVWHNDDFFSSRSLDVYISKLRRHLNPDPAVKIINHRGFGYKLIC